MRFGYVTCVAGLLAATAVAQVQSPPTARPKGIVVAGVVNLPGLYPVDPSRPPTLSAAIAQAGGVTVNAGDSGFIYRAGDNGATREIPVSFRDILSGKQTDISLQAGDVLYIPASTDQKTP